MSANHLIIGLGGTGGKIIRAFRKSIYQEFRRADPDVVNIEYLYVDSSRELMDPDDPTWRVLGKNVQLGTNSQLLITGSDLRSVLNDINAFRGIKDWIGNREEWASILNSIVGETLGGQKRRLGRFLFANKASQFKQLLQQQVRALQLKGEVPVTFHVCLGLAGGTGSGSLIDVLAQVRHTYPDPRTYRILIYALLPDRNPKPNWDTGNYHANGYAALLELNALSVGVYQPHDVTGSQGRLSLSDPFNGCYLFSNENEKGRSVDVSSDIPNIVADFLFQKIVTVRTVQWEALRRMENAENGDGSPEAAPGARAGERSKRFLTFGIKRLAIPEEEIREYLTYSFARQATLQLQYNNWVDGLAFADEPQNRDFREQATQRELLQRWLISDDHLRLSIGVLPSEQTNERWQPINATWQDIVPHFKGFVRESLSNSPKVWLDELAKLFEKRYASEYRQLGVEKFYRTKEGDRKDHLREIRARIERDLIEEWRNGTSSMADIRRLLEALVDQMKSRLDTFDRKIVEASQNAEDAAKKVNANKVEWAKVGFISGALGKRDRLFDAQAECLRETYTYKTHGAAWRFAKALLQAIIGDLTALLDEAGTCASTISEATQQFNDAIAARLTDGGQTDIRQQLVKYYDPQGVKDLVKTLVMSKEEQAKQTQAVRDALIAQLGPTLSFASFNQRITKDRFRSILELQCEESARQAHEILVADNKDRGRILGDSIIERLRREFSSNPEGLQRYIRELVQMAGNYVTFRLEEINRRGEGIPDNTHPPITSNTIFLPDTGVDKEFNQAVQGAFSRSTTGPVDFIPSKEVPCEVKPNEITIISVANLFPLRFLEETTWLKEKYDGRVNGGESARARLELHGEGDGTQFPSLFAPTMAEVRGTGLPYLLLARTLGILQEVTMNGRTSLCVVTKDEDGFDNDPILLGDSLLESETRLDEKVVRTIRNEVDSRLGTDDVMNRKDAIQQSIVSLVEKIKVERGNNVQDEQYRRFLDGGKKAVSILKKEQL